MASSSNWLDQYELESDPEDTNELSIEEIMERTDGPAVRSRALCYNIRKHGIWARYISHQLIDKETMEAIVYHTWKLEYCLVYIHHMGPNLFLIVLNNWEFVQKIMALGRFVYNNKLLYLQHWMDFPAYDFPPFFDLPPFDHIKCWIRVLYMPRSLHTLNNAIKIGKLFRSLERIGESYFDSREGKDIMRLEITLALTDPLVPAFEITLSNGQRVEIRIQYEGIFSHCSRCGQFDHSRKYCQNIVKREYEEFFVGGNIMAELLERTTWIQPIPSQDLPNRLYSKLLELPLVDHANSVDLLDTAPPPGFPGRTSLFDINDLGLRTPREDVDDIWREEDLIEYGEDRLDGQVFSETSVALLPTSVIKSVRVLGVSIFTEFAFFL